MGSIQSVEWSLEHANRSAVGRRLDPARAQAGGRDDDFAVLHARFDSLGEEKGERSRRGVAELGWLG